MGKGDTFALYVGVGVIIALIIAAVTFGSCVVLAWAWNFLAPLFWKAAPVLTWLHALAATIIVGLVRGLFTVNQKVEKKS